MLPDFKLLGFEFSWYSSFHYAGSVAAILFGFLYYRKVSFKINRQTFLLLFLVLYLLMMTGARLAGMIEIYLRSSQWPEWELLLGSPAHGNFRWCGSLLFIILFLPVITKKILKIHPFEEFFDMLAMCFCLGTVFTKQGCQFLGDACYGIPTTLPWGMYYPYGPAPNLLPVHPTPIYDSLFHLLLFIGLIYGERKKSYMGQTANRYFIFASIFYILLEIIRLNPKTSLGFTIPQLSYSLILLIVFFQHYKSIFWRESFMVRYKVT